MLHAKETGISPTHLGLWVMCTFTFYLTIRSVKTCKMQRYHTNVIFYFFLQVKYSNGCDTILFLIIYSYHGLKNGILVIYNFFVMTQINLTIRVLFKT